MKEKQRVKEPDIDNYVLTFKDRCTLELVGGKAFALSQLAKKGFTVPEGFCITTRAFDYFTEYNNISLDKDTHKIMKGAMPLQLKRILLNARKMVKGSCAVRSSSPLEDLKNVSSAGQYKSVLNVTGEDAFLDAVKEVWASLWGSRAVEYRKRMGIIEDIKMAVLVQEMVPAEASGVLFTEDNVVIEAVFGLSDTLVGGKVTPDRYIIERDTLKIVEKKISHKKVMSQMASKGIRAVVVPEEKQDVSVLDDAHIQELCRTAQKVETFFRCPQDMEWALFDNTLFLLQARPITVTPIIWSRANAAETHPGYVYHLSRTPENKPDDILLALLPLFERFGIKNVPEDMKMTGFIYGHVYLNMSVAEDILSQIPGLSTDVLYQSLGHTTEGASPSLKVSSLVRLLPGTLRVIQFFLTLPKKAEKVIPYSQELIGNVYQENLEELTLEELDNLIWEMYDRKSQLFQVHACTALAAMSLFGLLQKMVARKCETGMENTLTVGLEGMSSTQLGIEMWKLAEKASQYHRISQVILSRKNVLEELKKFEDGITFLKDLDMFMQGYGDRCSEETEFAVPRWREEPEFVLSMVATYLRSHADPLKAMEEQKRVRMEAKHNLLKKMHNPLEKLLFTKILEKTEQYIVTRENLKTVWVKYISAMRVVYLVMADKLVERQLLKERDDIFHLTMAEVSDLAKSVIDVQQLILTRKREKEEYEHLEVPDVIRGKPPSPDELKCVIEYKDILKGMGCSPGVASGKARVCMHPSECTELEEGDILVTPVTDPGWSPLFVTAGGLVMELGGTLSHGVIIAREYGIPAVVGVKNATKVIKTGQTITIDGNKGLVYIG
jgi:phosphohistidine swiveling domain-containing protein